MKLSFKKMIGAILWRAASIKIISATYMSVKKENRTKPIRSNQLMLSKVA